MLVILVIHGLTLKVLKVTGVIGINCLREVFQLKEPMSRNSTEDEIRSKVFSLFYVCDISILWYLRSEETSIL